MDDADRWVTVFGFPPAAASAVLAQFSQLGHIVEHRFPGQGNWVNLCYQTRLDARRALSYNGKVLPSHVMVGVIQCKDSVSLLLYVSLESPKLDTCSFLKPNSCSKRQNEVAILSLLFYSETM